MAGKYAIGVLTMAVLLLCLPMSATAEPEAGQTATVTITATGFVVDSPEDITATYVSDTAVQVRWTPGVDAANTMVRAAYDDVPADREDGYLVYYGADDSVLDTSVDLASADTVYYRAWSEDDLGRWEETGVWTQVDAAAEAVPTMLHALMVLGIAGVAVWRKHIILLVAAFAGLAFFGFMIAEAMLSLGIWILAFACYMMWLIWRYFYGRQYDETY